MWINKLPHADLIGLYITVLQKKCWQGVEHFSISLRILDPLLAELCVKEWIMAILESFLRDRMRKCYGCYGFVCRYELAY